MVWRKVNDSNRKQTRQVVRGKSRMPENSVFYEKLVPVLLILMALIMVVLILFAVGVLIGVVPFR